jgi:O-antigen/teichoic acid export membrane protein
MQITGELNRYKKIIFETSKIKRNAIIAMFLRFVVLALGFLVVKLAYPYLDQTRYGIWMTTLAIFQWVGMMDFGISSGLRNKLTESLAKEDSVRAKSYVSTAYGSFGAITLLLIFASLIITPRLNYSAIFNVDASIGAEIKTTLIIITPLFLFNIYASMINAVLYAKQDSALYDFRCFIFNIMYIATIIVIRVLTHNSFCFLALSYIICSIGSFLILSVILFTKRYRDILPGIRFIRGDMVKELLGLGIPFFVLQVAGVVLMSADNMLITQLLGPEYVSVYQIVNKPFLVMYIFFTGITSPLWSAFTDYYARNDLLWIRGTIRKMLKLLLPMGVFLIIIALVLKPLIFVWIGRDLEYSLLHVVLMCVYVLQLSWNAIFVSFCNGVGKLKTQLFFTLASAGMNFVLSFVFVKDFSMGLSGIVLSLIASNMLISIALPVITLKTLRQKAVKGCNMP